MFDFSSLSVSSTASTPAMSTSQIQHTLKEMAIAQVLPQGTNDFVRTDTAKFAIPFDFEGKIRWVELSFVAKKDDYDAAKAEQEYQVKCEQARLREADKARKKNAIPELPTVPVELQSKQEKLLEELLA